MTNSPLFLVALVDPGGPWRRELKAWLHFTSTMKFHEPFLKKANDKPALLSLPLGRQVQGCPVIEHRSIKMLSNWPLNLSRFQLNNMREYWKSVCVMKHKCESHISSMLSWVTHVPFLSWSSWLTSQSLIRVKKSPYWALHWCTFVIFKVSEWKLG